jgi:hypothetical protein
MHRTRNAAWVQAHRGFESLPLRQRFLLSIHLLNQTPPLEEASGPYSRSLTETIRGTEEALPFDQDTAFVRFGRQTLCIAFVNMPFAFQHAFNTIAMHGTIRERL